MNLLQIRSRIVTNILLFFTVLYTPWWFVAAAIFLGVWYFKNFYEAFFFGLFFDILYGANAPIAYEFRFFFSLAFLFLVVAAEFVKGKVRI